MVEGCKFYTEALKLQNEADQFFKCKDYESALDSYVELSKKNFEIPTVFWGIQTSNARVKSQSLFKLYHSLPDYY